MGRGSRHPHCSKKYTVPLDFGAWLGIGGENEESEGTTTGGEGVVILPGGGGNRRTGVPYCVLLRQCEFSISAVSDAIHNISTNEYAPYRLAGHPGGKDFVCSVGNNCRLFTLKKAADDDGETRIFSDEREIEVLQGVGEQNSLVFSADGTRLAAGGDDGHLRVVEWSGLKVILDQVDAHKPIKDLDFSLGAAFLASTSDDSGCRIWDLAKGTCVTSLPSVKGEGYGFARFSRDGTKPLLFVTTRKGSKGFVSAFDTSTWRQVKSKKLQEVPISAFAISQDGKLLAIGSCEGDVAIVDAATLSIQQRVRQAHMICVTAMEFDPNGQAVLTVSADQHRLSVEMMACPPTDQQRLSVEMMARAVARLCVFPWMEALNLAVLDTMDIVVNLVCRLLKPKEATILLFGLEEDAKDLLLKSSDNIKLNVIDLGKNRMVKRALAFDPKVDGIGLQVNTAERNDLDASRNGISELLLGRSKARILIVGNSAHAGGVGFNLHRDTVSGPIQIDVGPPASAVELYNRLGLGKVNLSEANKRPIMVCMWNTMQEKAHKEAFKWLLQEIK